MRLFLLALLLNANICAAGLPPALSNLKAPQIDDVFNTFSANFAFRPLEPASVYGQNWGVTAGLIVGATNTSKLTSSIPSVKQTYFPNAMIMAGAHGAYGIGVEAGYLPAVNVGGFHAKMIGGALKWTFTELLPPSVFAAAWRVIYSNTSMAYAQTVGGVSDTLVYKNNTEGTSLSMSVKLAHVEPFVGGGYLKQNSTLSNSGSFALFDTSASTTSSYSGSGGSLCYYAGVMFLFGPLTVAAQHDSLFGVNVESFKIAMRL